MQTISFTEFQKDPGAILKHLDKSHDPIRITRKGRDSLLLLPESELAGWKETFYLMKSPKNAERLQEAQDDFHNGMQNYHEHELIEPGK